MDILEAMSQRVSVRNYRPESAATAELDGVRRAGEEAETLTQAQLEFHLYPAEQMAMNAQGILSNFWKIIRAPHYIVLVARESEGYLLDSGFRFEQMIVEATLKNLGTCWIGGMFKEASFRSNLGFDSSWRVVALTPIGHPAGQGFMNRALRAVARSSTRKPLDQIFFWQVHGAPLPPSVLADGRLARMLEVTRLAPSWANKQPWHFILTGREVLVYKQMRQDREGKDYHLVDCGIAMAHWHLSAKALGIGSRWELGRFEVPGAPDAEPIGRYSLVISNRSSGRFV